MTNESYQKFKSVNQLTINYLNLNFPNWNTHAELGFKADPFLMSSFFENYKYFGNEDYTSSRVLQIIYTNINSKYAKFKQEYKFEFNAYANYEFFNEYVESKGFETLEVLKLEKAYFLFINELKKEIVFIPKNYTLETQLN